MKKGGIPSLRLESVVWHSIIALYALVKCSGMEMLPDAFMTAAEAMVKQIDNEMSCERVTDEMRF